ncbi:hypothetical protein BH20VER1_BH20VER1_09480 [soil metagenome]
MSVSNPSETDTRANDEKNQKPEGENDKLIRLDDLIPKRNVRGGRQLLFGASDTSQPTHNKKKEEQ